MYDPHRLRRNDRRFFTRKGQIIQAKNIDAPFSIERNKVQAYKEYILKNGLIPRQTSNKILTGLFIRSYFPGQREFTIPFTQFIYTSTTVDVPLNPPFNLIIVIDPNSSSANIVRFNTTTQETFNVSFGTMYYVINFPQYSDNYEFQITFQSGSVDDLTLNIYQNQYIQYDDVYFPKSGYTLQLPAPSD